MWAVGYGTGVEEGVVWTGSLVLLSGQLASVCSEQLLGQVLGHKILPLPELMVCLGRGWQSH